MSYIRFRQQCQDCWKIWNAAFGIVGTTRIAEPPHECPFCGSKKLAHYGDGWKNAEGKMI